MAHFPGVEAPVAEALEQHARRIAEAIRPMCVQVDNFRMAEARMIATEWGPISYILQTVAATTHRVGEAEVRAQVPSAYLLMGVQQPRASVEQLVRFPLILRRVALLLGAPDSHQLTMYENEIGPQSDGLGRGHLATAGGDVGEANARSQAARLTIVDRQGEAARGGLMRGAVARSITFEWPAR